MCAYYCGDRDNQYFDLLFWRARESMLHDVCALCILKPVGDLCLRVEFNIDAAGKFNDEASSGLFKSRQANARRRAA